MSKATYRESLLGTQRVLQGESLTSMIARVAQAGRQATVAESLHLDLEEQERKLERERILKMEPVFETSKTHPPRHMPAIASC